MKGYISLNISTDLDTDPLFISHKFWTTTAWTTGFGLGLFNVVVNKHIASATCKLPDWFFFFSQVQKTVKWQIWRLYGPRVWTNELQNRTMEYGQQSALSAINSLAIMKTDKQKTTIWHSDHQITVKSVPWTDIWNRPIYLSVLNLNL